jgi:hypothetical protein
VKNVELIRDPTSGVSKGICFIEFHTKEHAAYALQSAGANHLQLDRGAGVLKVAFVKPSFMAMQLAQVGAALHIMTYYIRAILVIVFLFFFVCNNNREIIQLQFPLLITYHQVKRIRWPWRLFKLLNGLLQRTPRVAHQFNHHPPSLLDS